LCCIVGVIVLYYDGELIDHWCTWGWYWPAF